MYNKATLIGRLTRDPETRVTASGITVTRFTVAVDRFRKKDTGESVTDFLRVVAWRRLAEICGEYLTKGKLIAVEGRLQLSEYEKDGERRQMTEIVADNVQMLDRGNTQSMSAHQLEETQQ
jgi:single-strand DNA-binding protein